MKSNPYSPPVAAVADVDPAASDARPHTGAAVSSRPGWVWAISIFFGVSAGWTLLSFTLILAGSVPLNAAQIAYFDSLGALDYVSSLGIGLANLLGAISLFRLRKIAFYLFAAALIANVLMTVWHVAAKDWGAALGGAGLVGAVIGLGLLVLVCAYSRYLLQRGVLR